MTIKIFLYYFSHELFFVVISSFWLLFCFVVGSGGICFLFCSVCLVWFWVCLGVLFFGVNFFDGGTTLIL